MEYRGLKNCYSLRLTPIGQGGEGDVYAVENAPNYVAKVYHKDKISKTLEEKLRTMLQSPPSQDVLAQVAWPLDLLYDETENFCGFVMPKLKATSELLTIYPYPPKLNISLSQKLIIAQNICAVIAEVHESGYVFGDFNPRNIGVDLSTGRVAFFDTDSYHIFDPLSGKTYRCAVCLDGYVAPELLKKCEGYTTDAYLNAQLPTFTKETDNFALSIHIFKLLMNGYTPFNGIMEDASRSSSTASPGVGNVAVKRDSYCFKAGNKPQAVAVPPFDTLPQEIVVLFTRAFVLGKTTPTERPSASEWYEALSRYESCLKTCSKNKTHQYWNKLRVCPWCEADARYHASINKPQHPPTLVQKSFSDPIVQAPPVSASSSVSANASVNLTNAAAKTAAPAKTAPTYTTPAPHLLLEKKGKNYDRNVIWDVLRCILIGLGWGYLTSPIGLVLGLLGVFLFPHANLDFSDITVLFPLVGLAIGLIRGIYRNVGRY